MHAAWKAVVAFSFTSEHAILFKMYADQHIAKQQVLYIIFIYIYIYIFSLSIYIYIGGLGGEFCEDDPEPGNVCARRSSVGA